MEISRLETSLERLPETISGFDTKTEMRLLGAVAAMFGNMNTYGKKWAVAVGQGWLMALRMATDISPDEFQAAVCRWMAEEQDFPAPAAVLGWIRAQKVNIARQEELREFGRLIRLQDEENLRASNLERYQTENPTREQIDERLAALAGSTGAAFSRRTNTEGPLWSETPEDAAAVRTREQIAELKRQRES